MSNATVPPIGFERAYRGQSYRMIGTFKRARANGTEALILTWASPCAECGAQFTFTTPAASSKFAPNRRCPEHKRPGCRVKGGAA